MSPSDCYNRQGDQSQSALDKLGKPRQAAMRFGELLSQQEWAVLGIGLDDLRLPVELYGEEWLDQVLELVAELLLSTRKAWGDPDDLLARLATETFLVITRAANATSWKETLRQAFNGRISSTFSPACLCDGLICSSPTQRLPPPSLVIGIITDRDGPFANPRDLLDKVTQARDKNRRAALVSEWRSLMVTVKRLREEIQVAEHAPVLVPPLDRFAAVTTGPLHDLRNGLNILYEATRDLSTKLSAATSCEALITATRYSRLLLETCSEVRLRGTGVLQRTSLSELLVENKLLWTHTGDIAIALDLPSQDVEIYADSDQVAIALFNVLNWLAYVEQRHLDLVVSCQSDAEQGRVAIAGDFGPDVHKEGLIQRALSELQGECWPFLYVLQKLVARNDGHVEFEPGRVTLSFPRYRWQDICPVDALVEQIQLCRQEVDHLQARLADQEERKDTIPLKDVIGLGSWAISELENQFEWIRQTAGRERQSAGEQLASLWESLEAGSHFCQLLTANLLALEGERPATACATDVAQVLASVQRILRSRIEGIAELEWNVEANLPPVKATETTLAQVVMNLALNALEELARVHPTVSRLGFAARRMPGAVQIDISDTGGGLPPEIKERVFKEMVSACVPVESGIGLYVVKAILDEWGGEIAFSSAEDLGTTARVTLPVWESGQ